MKLFLALVMLLAAGFGAYIFIDITNQPASVVVTTFAEAPADNAINPVVTKTVTRTKAGYVPAAIVVSLGDTVVWKNDTGEYHWPASDYHPAHTEYADFDPKRPLAPAEDWSFTFDKVGEWGFHDHLDAAVTGTVYVEDPHEQAFNLQEGQVFE